MDSELHLHLVPSDDLALRKELEFERLNALGFVRGSTSQEQFFLLMNSAWEKTGLPMNQTQRDYLAVMINRFVGRHDLFDQLDGFEFCSYLLGLAEVDERMLHDLADISLLSVAFFPDMSKRRHHMRSLTYSAQLGESLYTRLAKDSAKKDDWFSEAWKLMAKSFGQAVMVLRSAFPQYGFVHKQMTAPPGSNEPMLTDVDATRKLRHWTELYQMYFKQPEASGTPTQVLLN